MLERGLFVDDGVHLLDKNITISRIEYLFLKSGIPDEQLKKYKDAGVRIGTANWTIPGFMPIPYLVEIIDKDISPAEIDTEFSQGFLENDEKEVKKLFTSMPESLDKKYHAAFKEIKFAYENQRYIACVALLFPLLEGIVRDYNGRDKDGVNVEGKKVAENGSYNPPTIDADLKSVNIFLGNYFASSIIPSPDITKRNTLLHGESFSADKMTCIRLLNCIHSVLSISAMVDSCAYLIEKYQKEQGVSEYKSSLKDIT